MRKSEKQNWAVAFFLLLVGVARIPVAAQSPSVPPVSPESPAFHEFTQRVQKYVKLHKAAPRLRPTKQRQEIVARRAALARKIRQARSDAKPGDIFTPEASTEFRRVIQSAFQGPNAPSIRKTIRQGEPVPTWHLSVNGDYPEHLPVTTFPPTLLLSLPQLPSGVSYRIIGHDFVLQDTEARLVVDFIPGALP
jgi:hypothetical protein